MQPSGKSTAAPVDMRRDERSKAGALADLSPRGQNLSALTQLAREGPAATAQRQTLADLFGAPERRAALSSSAPAQRMKVRTQAVPATLSKKTSDKHVVALDQRESEATAGYHSRTFVDSAAAITDVVNNHDHDFAEAKEVRGRFDFEADVTVYVYMKANPGKNVPAVLTDNGVARRCEIGVEKTGDDRIEVVHFQKKA